MGRRLQSIVPTVSHLLTPANVGKVQGQLKMLPEKQKHYYDRGSKALPELNPLDVVRIRTGTQWLPGFVESRHPSPRSFNVIWADGSHLRRNRSQLLSTKEAMPAINNDGMRMFQWQQYVRATETSEDHKDSLNNSHDQ